MLIPVTKRLLKKAGMINEVVEDGQALDAARALARRIIANAPLAVAASRDIVIESRDWSMKEMFERTEEYRDPVFNSNEAKEGVGAFAEKRATKWKGT